MQCEWMILFWTISDSQFEIYLLHWNWLFVNSCKFKSLISFTVEFLTCAKLQQHVYRSAVCLGCVLKHSYT